MKLSALKILLDELKQVEFILPDGSEIPKHFHVTEIGKIEKNFVDCGGTIRKESVINFQLWSADDYNHRLSGEKLKSIIELSERVLSLENLEIEVEYEMDTIGKYNLDFINGKFILKNTNTDCLAKGYCILPNEESTSIETVINQTRSSCKSGSGCC
ncbi:MAG: hypothetical protein CMP67_03380 [Flavobacteriales bacterium]|nr:hypothetical protein [Flavobacteriales bacterium]|tara:strand:+ start:267 stop:737 length:471 start_codon:yes stop_codon:yes gene_type:complete